MAELKADLRDIKIKGKQLRKIGFIPAIIYGRNLENSVCIKIDEPHAIRMLKHNAIGAQIEIQIGKDSYNTMLKDVSLDPLTNKLLHMDFLALTKGEVVAVKARLNILNKDAVPVDGILQELVNELSFKALPKDLVDHVDVDVANMTIGDTLRLEDLPIYSDDRYSFSDEPTMDIIHVGHANKAHEPEEGEEDLAPAESSSADVPVIGEKDSE